MRGNWRRGVVAAAALSVIVAGIAAPVATAAPADFYTPPSELSTHAPGDLIRSEPSELALRVPGTDGAFPADGRRIMYRSSDANGAPNAVTGTYLDPQAAWTGPGPRPLVSLAVGTHGQGDQCAPSKLLNQLLTYQAPIGLMTEYEVLGINALLLQGIAVVITDYDGLGTPGVHTYVNRAAEGHAVLDAARAAKNLPGTSISATGPVGFWGYSQGGGAAAAAAELAEGYAPELDVKGTYAGAPPADLAATLEQIDGSFLTGAIGYAINGLVQAYPESQPLIEAELNDKGKAMLAATQGYCVVETGARFAFQKSSEYTKSGESLSVVLDRLPLAKDLLERQRIGKLTPSAPVLIQSGTHDDVVPFGQARELAGDWCGGGAVVQFSENPFPGVLPGSVINHGAPLVLGLPEAVTYMVDRFHDRPAPSTCAV
ncbi:lipase family protein [Rhodococcus sp. NPDC058481]|uniref:lipase family protein n=1 Tax=unclassified Rhodococcus (in: high G+C Gram-positive bacteria) TaxID=192944 RepID=UPI003653325B